jgi:hypothetical protein
MGGLLQDVQRILRSRVPTALPAGAVVTYFPNMAAPTALATNAAANTYGNNVEVLAAGGNATGVWVFAIYGCIFSRAAMDYMICVATNAAGAQPNPILGEAVFQTETTAVADHHEVVEFYKPVFVPAGVHICLAAANGQAAADTCAAWALCALGL